MLIFSTLLNLKILSHTLDFDLLIVYIHIEDNYVLTQVQTCTVMFLRISKIQKNYITLLLNFFPGAIKKSKISPYWIGANSRGGNEGWRWSDGSPFSLLHWMPGMLLLCALYFIEFITYDSEKWWCLEKVPQGYLNFDRFIRRSLFYSIIVTWSFSIVLGAWCFMSQATAVILEVISAFPMTILGQIDYDLAWLNTSRWNITSCPFGLTVIFSVLTSKLLLLRVIKGTKILVEINVNMK